MNLLKESSFYEMILREGEEKGRKEGELGGARKVLIRFAQNRFGRPDQATRSRL